MNNPINPDNLQDEAKVKFTCFGQAVGKMRNELKVEMTSPMHETFSLATDEGSFHGGDATAPPPLALFIASLTGCIMTQIRAFSKRMKITIDDLKTETRITWNWKKLDNIYETAPESFDIDVYIESSEALVKVKELILAAKKGCFIEQTLGKKNTINHKLKIDKAWIDV
jgi:uncharacterized OsmC-like protein